MTVRAFFEFLNRWRVLLQVAFVVVLTAGYIWLEQDRFAPFIGLETRMLDWRMQVRPKRPVPPDIIILGVDESTFRQLPPGPGVLERAPDVSYLVNQWPWNRSLWAHMTEKLLGAGAQLVAFDFLFTGPTPGDEECAAVFEKHANRVVVTARLAPNEVGMGSSKIITDPQDELIPLHGPEIVGIANFESDFDGVERRVIHGYNTILLQKPEWGLDPKNAPFLKPDQFSFSWLAAQKVLGKPPALDPAAPMFINFYGPPDSIKIIPLEDVIINWDTERGYQHGAYFKNMVVFIGPISEVRFKDNHATPLGNMAGVEAQATAFANLVHNDFLRMVPDWVAPALAVVFGLLALMVTLRVHSVLAKMGVLVGLGVVFAVVTQWLFAAHFVVVPVTGAALGLVGCGGFGTMYDFVLERYERRRMLGVFESMVSPGVANLVLSHRDEFEQRLGGQRRPVVILFMDIRGFTTWSEKVGPEALVAQLNEYFFAMVEVIQAEGGTVQKYIGDALMAAWGDVREQPLGECSVQAVRAAFRMEESLKKLNADWVGKAKREQLGFGIGINMGEGVIGRIGHPRRQEFTVMGDAVNLAARLESATKQYHQTVLVGEQIYELTKEKFFYRLADKMQVKGKTFAVPVYTPLAARTETPPPGVAEYDIAIEKYYTRHFAEAAELFRMANEKMGGDDFLCKNYLERCGHFLVEPPPADWDGGWTLKEK